MATRAADYAKKTAKFLGIASAIIGGIAGALMFPHMAVAAFFAGALVGGINGVINGAILGAVVGVFFKKKPSDSDMPGGNGQSVMKRGRSSQPDMPMQDLNPGVEQGTGYRDMVMAQSMGRRER